MNETNKEEQKRYDAEKVMAMTNFKKFYPEYQGATVEKIVEKEVIKEIIKADPKIESELMELKDLLEFKDDEIMKLKDALSDALNAEQEARKKEIDLATSNAKLKKALAEFTIQ